MTSNGMTSRIIPDAKSDALRRSGVRIIGLTGGAGSGKSEVASVFESAGIPVVYADRVGHELLEDAEVKRSLRAAFGESVFAGGKVDRAKLRARVFEKGEARQMLNNIVHPRMADRIESLCRDFAERGHRVVVIDGALLCENGEKEAFLDGLIVVDCDREARIARLMRARGLSRQEVEQLLNAQLDPWRKLMFADWVIQNRGRLEDLHQAARELAKELMTCAC